MSDTTDTDTPEQPTPDSVEPESAPLPPYPSTLGRPILHAVRQLRWGKAIFNERALADHDVVRTRNIEVGDVYHVGHPELMRRILLTDRGDFRKIGSTRLAFGDGLLSVEGEEWRRQRDLLQPLFVRKTLRGRTDEMVAWIRRYTDRWTDDLRAELHDFAFAPFGGGPRICIGRQFAMQEAKVALAIIGRRYDLTWLGDDADGRPPLSTKMTLRMEEGQEFRITER